MKMIFGASYFRLSNILWSLFHVSKYYFLNVVTIDNILSVRYVLVGSQFFFNMVRFIYIHYENMVSYAGSLTLSNA